MNSKDRAWGDFKRQYYPPNYGWSSSGWFSRGASTKTPGSAGSRTSRMPIWLAGNGRQDLASQLRRVMVPSQAIQGTAQTLSFMAYPMPRLTTEQRASLDLRDWESIKAPVQQGSITLDLDDFG